MGFTALNCVCLLNGNDVKPLEFHHQINKTLYYMKLTKPAPVGSAGSGCVGGRRGQCSLRMTLVLCTGGADTSSGGVRRGL